MWKGCERKWSPMQCPCVQSEPTPIDQKPSHWFPRSRHGRQKWSVSVTGTCWGPSCPTLRADTTGVWAPIHCRRGNTSNCMHNSKTMTCILWGTKVWTTSQLHWQLPIKVCCAFHKARGVKLNWPQAGHHNGRSSGNWSGGVRQLPGDWGLCWPAFPCPRATEGHVYCGPGIPDSVVGPTRSWTCPQILWADGSLASQKELVPWARQIQPAVWHSYIYLITLLLSLYLSFTKINQKREN